MQWSLVNTCVEPAVDLVGTYSKRQDLADQLRRVLDRLGRAHQERAEDPEESVRTTAKAAEPHRVVDRLGEQAVQQMIEERRAGVELRELAERYGISLSSVKRLLRSDVGSRQRR
jgi:AraC-like DNA-binding protein